MRNLCEIIIHLHLGIPLFDSQISFSTKKENEEKNLISNNISDKIKTAITISNLPLDDPRLFRLVLLL